MRLNHSPSRNPTDHNDGRDVTSSSPNCDEPQQQGIDDPQPSTSSTVAPLETPDQTSSAPLMGIGFYNGLWRAFWKVNGKRKSVSFGAKEYGNQRARQLAIIAREEAISKGMHPTRQYIIGVYNKRHAPEESKAELNNTKLELCDGLNMSVKSSSTQDKVRDEETSVGFNLSVYTLQAVMNIFFFYLTLRQDSKSDGISDRVKNRRLNRTLQCSENEDENPIDSNHDIDMEVMDELNNNGRKKVMVNLKSLLKMSLE